MKYIISLFLVEPSDVQVNPEVQHIKHTEQHIHIKHKTENSHHVHHDDFPVVGYYQVESSDLQDGISKTPTGAILSVAVGTSCFAREYSVCYLRIGSAPFFPVNSERFVLNYQVQEPRRKNLFMLIIQELQSQDAHLQDMAFLIKNVKLLHPAHL